jgi:hypothetical protein
MTYSPTLEACGSFTPFVLRARSGMLRPLFFDAVLARAVFPDALFELLFLPVLAPTGGVFLKF